MSEKNSSEDNLQMLFPTVVQVSQIPDCNKMNQQLLEAVNDIRNSQANSKPDSWACDLYTTIGNPRTLLKHPCARLFCTLAEDKLLQYANSLGYDTQNNTPRMTECWLNIYTSGHSQEIHLHRNNMFSGIYYVRAPENSGATLFYSPLADVMLEPRSAKGNSLNAKVSGFPPVEGRMLIFRSSLRHSVMPANFTGERITIAFNAVM